jgi:hypothetical protein
MTAVGKGFADVRDSLAAWVRDLPEPRRAGALWALACGAELGSGARVIAVRDGVVEVEAQGAARREAVESLSSRILSRMNELAGARLFRAIRVREAEG